MEPLVVITAAVEGPMDEAVLSRIVNHVGAQLGSVYGKRGKPELLKKLGGFNQAARFSPWAVLVDLDHDEDCAPPLKKSLLPNPSLKMCFRVAVREVEAWILADRERLSKFLGIRTSLIPADPESVDYPKLKMVELAKRSRRREIREDMVPRPESGTKIGPAYTSRMIEFIEDSRNGWRPVIAAENSDSLARCLNRLKSLISESQLLS